MSNERGILTQAAEDGDSLAAAALRDLSIEEDGLPTFWRPQRGDWIIIFTGAFFHSGQYLGEDHEYYSLAPGSAQIFETGEFERFFRDGICTMCETIPLPLLIRKGPVTHITAWPHNRPVQSSS